MIDCCLLGRRTAKDLRLPGVQVAVEMNDRDLTVGTVDGTQQREDDGMVPSESDDTWVMFAVSRDGNERLSGLRVVPESREGGAVKERLVAFLNLLDGKFVVVRRDGDVTAVDDSEAREERVNSKGHVVAAIQSQTT